MEWLFVPTIGVLIWLITRSVQQEQELSELSRRLKSGEELNRQLVTQARADAERLRGQVLELLRAHSQLQQRLGMLQEAINAEPSPPKSIEPAAPPVVPKLSAATPAISQVQDMEAVRLAAESTASADPNPTAPSEPALHADPATLAHAEAVHAESVHAEAKPSPGLLSEATTPVPPPPPPSFSPSPPLSAAARDPGPDAVAPAAASAPSFDWEQLLGVRGAAWLGGIALAVAGALFAKYSIENDLISPTLRIILLVLLALTALTGSEFFLRPRYTVTANAACGAGIAILYSAFFAAHDLYGLLPLPATFALMLLTTVTAALLSLRYGSIYIAVLGLLGGFATPLALSTGHDRPIGLFGYLLLLNLGFLWVAVQRSWHRLLSLSLSGTLLIQTGWAITHLSPQKLPFLVLSSLLFALLYILLPFVAKRFDPERHRALLWNATFAALWPFVFAVVLAAEPRYAERWPLLFALVLCVDLGLFLLAVERWAPLLWPALFGTCLTQLAWATQHVVPSQIPILVGVSLGFALLFGLLPLLFRLRRRDDEATDHAHRSAATASLWPMLAALGVLSSANYDQRHLLLYGWTVSAFVWSSLTGLRYGRSLRLLGAATLLCLSMILWVSEQLTVALLWPSTLLVLGVVGFGSLLPRVGSLIQRTDVTDKSTTQRVIEELAATIVLIGLIGFAAVIIHSGLADPPWGLVLLLVALFVLIGERSRPSALPFVQPVLTLVVTVTLWAWLLGALGPDGALLQVRPAARVLRDLAIPMLFAVAMQVRAAIRSQSGPAQLEQVEQLGLLTIKQRRWDSELAAGIATMVCMLGVVLAMQDSALSQRPGLALGVLLGYNLLVLTTVMRQTVTSLLLLAQALSAWTLSIWHLDHFQDIDFATVMPLYGAFYLWFLLTPLLLLWAVPHLRQRRSLFFASGLSGPAFFWPIYKAWLSGFGASMVGVLPVVMATLSVAALALIQALPRPAVTKALSADELAERHLAHRALFAAVGLGFLALAIPLQLQKQWIGVAWSLEAAAVWWLYRRLPHPGLKYFGLLLYVGVLIRLIPDQSFLTYHERGLPVFNWLLYSYGVPCVAFLVGAAGLAKVEAKHRRRFEELTPLGKIPLAGVVYYTGLLLVFVLINIEIADAFSVGRYTELWQERSYARDLTRSLSWVLYALTLLVLGMRQSGRGQRFFSLGLMLLTVGKVFLYDLSKVGGIYRALSFLGLAVSLFVVSLLYQRLAFRNAKDTKHSAPSSEKPQ